MGAGADADAGVVESPVRFRQRDARDLQADVVVVNGAPEHLPGGDVDADAGIAVRRVVRQQHVRAGRDAYVAVVEGGVHVQHRLIGRVRTHAADADPRAGAVHDVVADGRSRARHDDAVAVRLVVHRVERDHGSCTVRTDAGAAVHRHVVERDLGVVVARVEPDADAAVAENAVVADRHVVAAGTGVGVHPVHTARDRQVVDREPVGVHQLEHVAARGRVGAVQDRLAARDGRALDQDRHAGGARVLVGHDDVRRERVDARVDEDHVAGLQVVGLQDAADRGLGIGRRKTAVGGVAVGGRRVLVVGVRDVGVVHVVGADRRRDLERPVAVVRQGHVVRARHAHAVVRVRRCQRPVD